MFSLLHIDIFMCSVLQGAKFYNMLFVLIRLMTTITILLIKRPQIFHTLTEHLTFKGIWKSIVGRTVQSVYTDIS